MNKKQTLLVIAISLSVGYGIGYFKKPAKVEVTTQTKERTKEQVKKDINKVENKDKIVVIKETRNADGSVTRETTITDRGTVGTTTKVDTVKEASRESSSRTVTTNDIGLTIQALAYVDTKKPSEIDSYGIYVKKRIIGNISLGFTGITDKKFDEKKIGLGLGYDF